MSGWLDRILARQRADDPDQFREFLGRHAAYVAQKTVLDYCRVKAGRREREMMENAGFLAALTHCRWQTYFGAVQDMMALAEAWLRPHAAGEEERLAEVLAALGDGILAADITTGQVPDTEQEALALTRASLPSHLRGAQLAPPAAPHLMPLRAEAPLFATLPVPAELRQGESVSIRGALRFLLVSAQQEMERSFAPSPLARRLLAEAP